MGETKIIYYIEDEDTPYLIKLCIPPDKVTLGDFKNALNRSNLKFFFKSMDDDFGVVKEELAEDTAVLPCINGRVVSWLVPAEGSHGSEAHSQAGSVDSHRSDTLAERLGGIGDSRPPSFHAGAITKESDILDDKLKGASSFQSQAQGLTKELLNNHRAITAGGGTLPSRHHPRKHSSTIVSSVLSSDLETTSACDTEITHSRYSTATSQFSRYGRQQRKKRRRHKPAAMSVASTISSVTESAMSLNIVTVTLNLDMVNFLGISIVGQTSKAGDVGGIYVGSIMKGGAVALDGRIEPGDMILEVNGVSFENMNNDDAVRLLRDTVQKPGPITLVVAKCWDPNPRGYFAVPQREPVRPIDPSAWVAHTGAMQQIYGNGLPGLQHDESCMQSVTSSSLASSVPQSERFEDCNLTKQTDMAAVVKAMTQLDSGLQICDRMWLKITIPNSFIGSDLVDWLCERVQGFSDRKDARKYAADLLKCGFIKHTVNKTSFSEQCYYVMGNDMADDMSSLALDEEFESVSEVGASDGGRPAMPAPPTLPPPIGRPPLPPPSLPSNSRNGSNHLFAVPMAPPPPAAKMYSSQDSASYVSMPGDKSIIAESFISGKNDQSCNCMFTHTYKQLRRLWDNDKHGHNSNRPVVRSSRPNFDDRSTSSSSSGSTVSADGQRHKSHSQMARGVGGAGRGVGVAGPVGRPLPGNGRRFGQSSSDTESSAADFYHRRHSRPPVVPRHFARPPVNYGAPSSVADSKHSFRLAMESSNALQTMGSL